MRLATVTGDEWLGMRCNPMSSCHRAITTFEYYYFRNHSVLGMEKYS